MADKKISQLTALAAANLAPSTDVLAIVDTSATETKKIAAQDIVNGVLNVSSAVGIGTASPAAKLDVNGNGAFSGTLTVTLPSSVGAIVARNSSTTATELHIRPNSGKSGWVSFTEDSVADRWIVGVKNGNGGLFFNTGNPGSNTDRMVLDSSGNLGLGVTPSAWRSLETALQYGGVGALSSYNSITTNFRNNCFINSSNAEKYIANGYALIYSQNKDTGVHAWLNAASGTAGNTITFTQALTLHASGGMSLGNTTDPGATNLSVTGTITSGKGANVASAATVTLGAGNFFDITGTTTISNITIKPAGTVVYLKFDSTINLQTGTIGNSGAMRLESGATLVASQYDVLTLISDGTNWWQTAFSAN